MWPQSIRRISHRENYDYYSRRCLSCHSTYIWAIDLEYTVEIKVTERRSRQGCVVGSAIALASFWSDSLVTSRGQSNKALQTDNTGLQRRKGTALTYKRLQRTRQ